MLWNETFLLILNQYGHENFDGLEWLDFLDVGWKEEEACLSAKTAIK